MDFGETHVCLSQWDVDTSRLSQSGALNGNPPNRWIREVINDVIAPTGWSCIWLGAYFIIIIWGKKNWAQRRIALRGSSFSEFQANRILPQGVKVKQGFPRVQRWIFLFSLCFYIIYFITFFFSFVLAAKSWITEWIGFIVCQ